MRHAAKGGYLEGPDRAARSPSGQGPIQVLEQQLRALVDARVLAPELLRSSALAAWPAVRGMAVLLLEGPLQRLPTPEQQAANDQLLEVVLSGMTSARASIP